MNSVARRVGAVLIAFLGAASIAAAPTGQTAATTTVRQSYFCTVGMRYGRNAGGVFYISSVFQLDGDPRILTKATSQAWVSYVDETFAHYADARGDECKSVRDARILEQTRTFYLGAQSDPDADPVIDTGWSYTATAARPARSGPARGH